jgi:hypothetical protein
LDDSSSEKSFAKFTGRLAKQYARQLDEFDEHECFESEAFRELYEFMGVSVPRKSQRKAKRMRAAPEETIQDEQESDEGGVQGSTSDEDTPKDKRTRYGDEVRNITLRGSAEIIRRAPTRHASTPEEGDDRNTDAGDESAAQSEIQDSFVAFR